MLNFWSKDNNLSASSVKEVNEHMQGMHARITDLEQRVREQSELLERREQQHTARYNQLRREKDLEIANIQRDYIKTEEKCAVLEKAIREKDVNIAYLLHRCSYLDEAASYAPLLDQLSNCLKNAFAAPPPKVQTVKPTRSSSVMSDKTPNQPMSPVLAQSGMTTRTNNEEK